MATTQIKDGYNGGSDNQLKVNSDGSINVDVTGGSGGTITSNQGAPGTASGAWYVYQGAFNPPDTVDSVSASYPTSVEEIYRYYTGGLSGTLLMTLTVTYTNSLKTNISSVVRT